MNAVMRVIYRGIAETKAWREYFDKVMRESKVRGEALETERQAEREATAEVERLAAERQQREQQLVGEANAWHQSNMIRAYVNHLMMAAPASGASISDELRAWLQWATDAAERMDPTTRRLDHGQT